MILECYKCHDKKDVTLFSQWRLISNDGYIHKKVKRYNCKLKPICKTCRSNASRKSFIKARDVKRDLIVTSKNIPVKFLSKREIKLREQQYASACRSII